MQAATTMEPEWVPRAIATGFLSLAVIVIVAAERRASAVHARLETHVVTAAKGLNLRLFAWLVTLGAIALIVSIWTGRIG